ATELNDPAATFLVPARPAASTFLTAPRPPSPIARGLAGPGLLAHLIVSKFCDHLPLYRCERMLARFGVNLSRSTMCDWLAQSAALLRPLWELLKGRVLQSRVVQTDDTPVRVQAQAGAAAHQGRLWVQVGDVGHPSLVYLLSAAATKRATFAVPGEPGRARSIAVLALPYPRWSRYPWVEGMLDRQAFLSSQPLGENVQRLGKKLALLPEAGSLGSHYLPWAPFTVPARAVPVKDSSATPAGHRSAVAAVC
ncbi:MAG TPA: transposase, partial [Dehalococcoidia bacterium]|nr:transposase [Dehalococcoidia bacterium]